MFRCSATKFASAHSINRLLLTQKTNYTESQTTLVENEQKPGRAVSCAYTSYETTKPPIGSKIPIIILHGFLGSKINWNTMGRQLAMRTLRRVVAVDARNHGDSPQTKEHNYDMMMEDVKLMMAELGLKEASFVGHSMGGRTMMALALRHPEMVKDVVAVDVSPITISDSIHYLPRILKAMKEVRISGDASLHKAREEADEQLKLAIRNKDLRRFLLMNVALDEKLHKFYWKLNIQSLDENFQNMLHFPKIEGKFSKPSLFVGGAQSDYLNKEEEPKIQEMFPMAKFVYIKDAGHLVHAQKPREFLEALSLFYGVQ